MNYEQKREVYDYVYDKWPDAHDVVPVLTEKDLEIISKTYGFAKWRVEFAGKNLIRAIGREGPKILKKIKLPFQERGKINVDKS